MSGLAGASRERGVEEAAILVLDVGTSSARAWLYDAAGRGVDPGPDAQRRYRWRNQPDEVMEADAPHLFELVAATIDAATSRAREAGMGITAVAVASFWHSLLGLDEQGLPATPLYAFGDSRAAAVALRLRDRRDEGTYHARTGCFLHPSYPAVRLAWLRGLDVAAFERVHRWVSFPEYLEARLFGEVRCSYSMASGTGLLDIHTLRWDEEALAMAGIGPERLSPLVDAGEPLRGLRAEYAARWPELADLPWFPALGDGACANVGSGAAGADVLGVTIGTTAAVRLVWEPGAPVRVPEQVWCYRLDARRWVAGGALSNGGNAVAFLRRFLHLPDERRWEASIAQMEPDSHGLTILPYLVDERGPGWLLEREAVVAGLSHATPPEHLLRAWMEALAYRIAGVSGRLEEAVGRVPVVRASGGALHASPIWAQIVADVLDREVTLSVEPEATARGAALVALEALGQIPDLHHAAAPVAARFEPDPERHRTYRTAMRRQEALAGALTGWLRSGPPHPDRQANDTNPEVRR